MQEIETLEEFYRRHPTDNQKVFAENNTGQGHFNVFMRKACMVRTPFSRRDFYKIALVIGNGKMHYTDKQVVIDRPALVFSSPSVTASWECGPGAQTGWFCLFTQAFIDSPQQKGAIQNFPLFKAGSSHIVFLTDSQLVFLSALLRKMMEEMDSEYPGKYDLLRNYLRILMHEALKIAPESSQEINAGAAARITNQFMELLERQFPIDSPGQFLKLKTANDFAKNLAVHTNHLNRSVKEVTYKTTTQHISERVLKEAQALLKHTDWSIAQIAAGLGFEEPAYFTNFFKKHTGSSPAMSRPVNI
ncbi:Helix-turn-helix domain-containing protein [Mucilaginibacter pineti]|uniref:Helix-turn-helix domain-containing protein n=1 Tax=Mucilaginibacter pineti TaxID=1391627 RepID=A0A1G6U326_9SPHI|nr:helix-turn-helix transcriptional regulator [Mucilaginibacter pineti]SDD35691.1 Helix-turn-helix domain-containing protein [Mucilaginibacter pineti]